MTMLLSLASIGGVSGGILTVPVFISLFGFGDQNTIAMSNAVVFIVTFFRYLYSANDSNPFDLNKTLIDHSLVCIMLPMLLIGGYVGVHLNMLFPNVLICIILTLAALYMTYSTTSTACSLFAKETEEINTRKYI